MQQIHLQNNPFVSSYPEYFAPNEAVIATTQTATISKNTIELLKTWIYHNQQSITRHLEDIGAIPRIHITRDIAEILTKIDQWLYFRIGEWRVYFRNQKELEDNLNQVNNIITSLASCWIDYALTWHNPANSQVFSKVSIKSFIDSFRLRCSTAQLDFLSRYTKMSDMFDVLAEIRIGSCIDIYSVLPEFVRQRIVFLLNIHPSSYQQHFRGDKLDNDKAGLLHYITQEINARSGGNTRQFLDPKPLHHHGV